MPGPGQYDPMLGKGSPGISFKGRSKNQRIEQLPGPGAYEPQFENVKARQGTAKFGQVSKKSPRLHGASQSMYAPGPGAYDA